MYLDILSNYSNMKFFLSPWLDFPFTQELRSHAQLPCLFRGVDLMISSPPGSLWKDLQVLAMILDRVRPHPGFLYAEYALNPVAHAIAVFSDGESPRSLFSN